MDRFQAAQLGQGLGQGGRWAEGNEAPRKQWLQTGHQGRARSRVGGRQNASGGPGGGASSRAAELGALSVVGTGVKAGGETRSCAAEPGPWSVVGGGQGGAAAGGVAPCRAAGQGAGSTECNKAPKEAAAEGATPAAGRSAEPGGGSQSVCATTGAEPPRRAAGQGAASSPAAGLGAEMAGGNGPTGGAAGSATPSHAVELGYKSAVGNGAGRGAKSVEGSL